MHAWTPVAWSSLATARLLRVSRHAHVKGPAGTCQEQATLQCSLLFVLRCRPQPSSHGLTRLGGSHHPHVKGPAGTCQEQAALQCSLLLVLRCRPQPSNHGLWVLALQAVPGQRGLHIPALPHAGAPPQQPVHHILGARGTAPFQVIGQLLQESDDKQIPVDVSGKWTIAGTSFRMAFID